MVQEGGNQIEARQNPWVKDPKLSSGRSERLEFTRQSAIKERCAKKRTLKIFRFSFLSSQMSTNQHICLRKLLESGERTA